MRLLFAAAAAAASLLAQTVDQPVRAVIDPGVVTTRQSITPAGVPTVFQGRVYGVTFGASSDEVWVLHATHVYRLDWRQNRVLDRVAHLGAPGLQGIVYDGSARRALVSGVDKAKKGRLLSLAPGALPTAVWQGIGANIAGAPSIGGGAAAVPLIFDDKVVVSKPGAEPQTVDTGIAPFAAILSRDGSQLWVSNWGGRLPTARDLTAPTGLAESADRVVVDRRGIASTGTVTWFDLTGKSQPASVAVGLHPTGMAWDENAHRLYVANNNTDTISVIDTRSRRLLRNIDLQPFTTRVAGVAPTAAALSQDGATLWVACGGINAILKIRTRDGRIAGMIPTAWYPNAIALSPDGKQLAVSTLLGAGSAWRDEPKQRFVHAYRGSVHVIDIPSDSQLAGYTAAVAENNHLAAGSPVAGAPPVRNVAPIPIPERAGEPTPIEHVVYIVKENRTYDQVFGDIPKGNGDPSLVMFGADVTPNQHRLADHYVLLDNFYASGGNSADGHQWLTQANETAYCLWPGYAGRSYPFDGSDPIAYSAKGFLWDLALARNKTVRIYGEYAGRFSEADAAGRVDLLKQWEQGADFTGRWKTRAPIEPLNKILAPEYPAYTNAIPDVARAQILRADIAKWVRAGAMPNLVIAQLPSDHTYGTRPGASTPKAMVADNDYAVGQIVEALSKTPFWKKMAIFIVEDDAQNGVDHVDGHRTTALVVSPFARRGAVDSTFYSNQSMVKTIELILGLPTLSLFDLIAHDMRNSFTGDPDFTPYQAVRPPQSLYDVNPAVKALRGPARQAAIDSARMRFEVPDAAPTDKLNRILWHSVRGWNTPYPGTRRGVFAPLSLDIDDDDRE
ncbi:MAG: bifunctional YncE family protein/alkaline phosphatase family protein [Bryobacteraceae bacterium]